MSNEEEIQKKIHELETRLKKVEELFFKTSKPPEIEGSFKGLNGGIRFLIKNGFLDMPRLLNEISNELRRLGYIYSDQSISKALLVDFMRNWRLLSRIKENDNWKYAKRK